MSRFWSLLSLSAVAAVPLQAAERPNIILFMVDDMGWQDTSVPFWSEPTALNATFRTPHMERMAQRGMKFTDAYASPISSPSRCSLLTGSNAARHHVTNWTMEPNVSTDLPHADVTPPSWNVNGMSPVSGVERTYYARSFVQILREAGYHTIHCGKAHFGARTTPGEDPLHWGFDVNIAGHAAGGLATYLSENNYGHRSDGTPYAANAIPGLESYWGTGTFATEALTREALAALDRRDAQQPFFLYMAHYAVHIPIDRDMRYYPAHVARGLDPREAAYASLVEGVDKSLGDIMAWLDRHELTDNTIIIFMSDNGGLASQPEWRSGALYTQNAPLSSGKGSLREGGIRVPLMVSWPGVVAPASVCGEPVIIEDLFPTILQMGAVSRVRTPQAVDGRSLLPLLKGERAARHQRDLVWNYPNVWGNEGPGISLCCALRRDRWKLIYHYDTRQHELYDLRSDIGETTDLSRQRPALVRRLARVLGVALRRMGAQRPAFTSSGTPCPWPDDADG